jgi:hypothetical protein
MNVVERAKAPTPKFFRVLRNIGLTLLVLSGCLIVAQVVLPTVVTIVVDYLAVAGGMLFAVSQMMVDDDKQAKANILNRIRKDNQNLPRDGIK